MQQAGASGRDEDLPRADHDKRDGGGEPRPAAAEGGPPAIGKDADPEKVALLVELSRGQLVLVKAILERKKAEAALAQKSEEYRKGREALRSIQESTKAQGEAPGEEP